MGAASWIRERAASALLNALETKDAQTRRASSGGAYVFGGQPYSNSWDVDKAVKDAYEKVIWVAKAVDAIADKASSWPLNVMEGTEPDWRKVDDPLLPLLNAKANDVERAAKFFRYRLSSQLILSKAGVFVEAHPTRGGGLAALALLPPGRTKPIPDPDTFLAGFEVTLASGEKTKLQVYDPRTNKGVIWIRKPHPTDPYSGTTPLEAAGISIDLDFYARLYNRNFLLNDGRAGQLVAVKGGLSPEDAQELKARFSPGIGGVGRTTVIEADAVSVQDTAMSPRDAQYAELRGITKEDLLIALGTPESVLGNASGRTFDNADAELENWLTFTVLNHCSVIESGLDVLTKGGWDDDRSVVHDTTREPVLQRAQRAREDRALARFQAGMITLDELREECKLPALARGVVGRNVLWIPAGMVPVGELDDLEAVHEALKPLGADGAAEAAAPAGELKPDAPPMLPGGAPVPGPPGVLPVVDGSVVEEDPRKPRALGAGAPFGKGLEESLDLESKRFNPAQPRYPHGHPKGGQWLDTGDTARWLAGQPLANGMPSSTVQTPANVVGSTAAPGGYTGLAATSSPVVQAAAAILTPPVGYPYARVLNAPVAQTLARPKPVKAVSLRAGDVVDVQGRQMTVASNKIDKSTGKHKLELVGKFGSTVSLTQDKDDQFDAIARTPHPSVVADARRVISAHANGMPLPAAPSLLSGKPSAPPRGTPAAAVSTPRPAAAPAPTPAPAAPAAPRVAGPVPPPGTQVFQHTNGKVVHVYPNGQAQAYSATGVRTTSSSTGKLAAGQAVRGWSVVAAPTGPPPSMPNLQPTAVPNPNAPGAVAAAFAASTAPPSAPAAPSGPAPGSVFTASTTGATMTILPTGGALVTYPGGQTPTNLSAAQVQTQMGNGIWQPGGSPAAGPSLRSPAAGPSLTSAPAPGAAATYAFQASSALPQGYVAQAGDLFTTRSGWTLQVHANGSASERNNTGAHTALSPSQLQALLGSGSSGYRLVGRNPTPSAGFAAAPTTSAAPTPTPTPAAAPNAVLGGASPASILTSPPNYPYPIVPGAPVATALAKPKLISVKSLRKGDVVKPQTGGLAGQEVSVVGVRGGNVTVQDAQGNQSTITAPGGQLWSTARTPHPTVVAAARRQGAPTAPNAAPTAPNAAPTAPNAAPTAPNAAPTAPNAAPTPASAAPASLTPPTTPNAPPAPSTAPVARLTPPFAPGSSAARQAWGAAPVTTNASTYANASPGQVYANQNGGVLVIETNGDGTLYDPLSPGSPTTIPAAQLASTMAVGLNGGGADRWDLTGLPATAGVPQPAGPTGGAPAPAQVATPHVGSSVGFRQGNGLVAGATYTGPGGSTVTVGPRGGGVVTNGATGRVTRVSAASAASTVRRSGWAQTAGPVAITPGMQLTNAQGAVIDVDATGQSGTLTMSSGTQRPLTPTGLSGLLGASSTFRVSGQQATAPTPAPAPTSSSLPTPSPAAGSVFTNPATGVSMTINAQGGAATSTGTVLSPSQVQARLTGAHYSGAWTAAPAAPAPVPPQVQPARNGLIPGAVYRNRRTGATMTVLGNGSAVTTASGAGPGASLTPARAATAAGQNQWQLASSPNAGPSPSRPQGGSVSAKPLPPLPDAAIGQATQVSPKDVVRGHTISHNGESYVVTEVHDVGRGTYEVFGYRPGVDDGYDATTSPSGHQAQGVFVLPVGRGQTITRIDPPPLPAEQVPPGGTARSYDSAKPIDQASVTANGQTWNFRSQLVAADQLQAGDVILQRGQESRGSIVVTKVDADSLGRGGAGSQAVYGRAVDPTTGQLGPEEQLFLTSANVGGAIRDVAVQVDAPTPTPTVPRPPGAASASGIVRNDISDPATAAKIQQIYNGPPPRLSKAAGATSIGDQRQAHMNEVRGYNATPDVVSDADLDRYIAAGEIELWRGISPGSGVTAEKAAEDYRTGEHYPGGQAGTMYGTGTYTAYGKKGPDSGLNFARGSYAPGVRDVLVRMSLKSDARIGEFDTLEAEMSREARRDPVVRQMQQMGSTGVGHYATYKGYDAIRKSNGYDSSTTNPTDWRYGFLVVLNRSAVRVSEADYVQNTGRQSIGTRLRRAKSGAAEAANAGSAKHQGTTDTNQVVGLP